MSRAVCALFTAFHAPYVSTAVPYALAYARARAKPVLPRIRDVYGVDFSGAKSAGRTLWVARARVATPRGGSSRNASALAPLRLLELGSLASLTGHVDRGPALAALVQLIARSRHALWAIDCPFGFPVEVMDPGERWSGQMKRLRAWEGDAYDFGLWCLDRARALQGPWHIYRETDRAAKAPFDSYHYRIIYQTFHGMRDVLGPLRRLKCAAILPFEYRALRTAERVVVETCPSSALKRLGLPYQNYKQPEGGPLLPKRRRTRREILAGIESAVHFDASQRRVMMRDPGGDALDAVLAAVGAWRAWNTVDHGVVAASERFAREGWLCV